MPSRHRSPLLGWHPPPELAAWVRAEAERRGVHLSTILNEAIHDAEHHRTTREALDAYAQQNKDLHRENLMLRDENVRLRSEGKVS